MGCNIFDEQICSVSNKESFNFFEADFENRSYIYNNDYFNKLNRLFVLLSLPTDGLPVNCVSSYVNILFCEGEAEFYIGDQKFLCSVGNILLFRDNCDFTVKPASGSTIYMACYKKEFFDNMFFTHISNYPIIYDFLILNNPKNEFLYFNCDSEIMLCHFAKILQLELCNKDSTSDTTVHCATILFLSNLHRLHSTNLVVSESSKIEEYLIGSILKYMIDNHTTATLTSTATHFNYHPAYFSSMFKKKTGCSFTRKMLEIRLEHARRLLISSNFSVQEIYERIGFQEKSYFHRCFKSVYGITPIQYRKNFQPHSM